MYVRFSSAYEQVIVNTSEGSQYAFDGSEGSFVTVSQDVEFQPSQGFSIATTLRQTQGNAGWERAKRLRGANARVTKV